MKLTDLVLARFDDQVEFIFGILRSLILLSHVVFLQTSKVQLNSIIPKRCVAGLCLRDRFFSILEVVWETLTF